MHKRVIITFSVIIFGVLCVAAKNLSPAEALQRVLHSPRENGIPAKSTGKDDYTLSYSSPQGTLYAFNRAGGGYIIVSGDDRVCPLLADVPSGTFSNDTIAPGARSILELYNAQISTLPDSQPFDKGLMDYYAEWSEIPAIMTTQWNQSAPYNIYCPVEGAYTCVTGCVATAMAQIVRAIGYYKGSGYRSNSGLNSKGEKVEFDYASAEFDFDNMFDTYPSPNVSSESVDQVARLMLACGLSVGMGYGASGSSAYSSSVPAALIRNFGYDSKFTRIYDNEDFSQAQWENMLYTQLRIGRPVYYSGGAHAYVVDGYRHAGLYHVNWGWGGMSDGYYRLSAIIPSQSGIGGVGAGTNYGLNADMVVAVPPGEDPGVIIDDITGSLAVVSDGVYSVYYKCSSPTSSNLTLGAVIVDSRGSVAGSAVFWENQTIFGNSALYHNSYQFDFSAIPLDPGDYRIYPSYRPEEGQDIIAAPCPDRAYFLKLTVTEAGEYIITSDPVDSRYSDLQITGIVPDTDLHEGFSGNFGFYAVNGGNKDYRDRIYITFIDAEGRELAVSKSTEGSFVAANANNVVYASFPVFDSSNSRIPVGTYSLRFSDADGSVISDREFSIEIKSGSPSSSWTSPLNIEVTNGDTFPATILRGDVWPHTPMVHSTETYRSMTLRLAFYPPSSNIPTATYLCYSGTISPIHSFFPIDAPEIDVPFGSYEVCYRKGYEQISERRPIRVGASVDGNAYLPAAGGGASVTSFTSGSELSEVVVPERVNIGGNDIPVTAVDPEAYMSNPSLSVIDLPNTVRTIGFNSLALCPALTQIILRSEEPPFKSRNHFAPGLNREAEFYVPADAYDRYRSILQDYNPVYAIVDAIGSASVTVSEPQSEYFITFAPAHPAVNPGFTVTPVDQSSAETAGVTLTSVESGRLNLVITAMREGTATYRIAPAHRSDTYGLLTVNVAGLSDIDGIDSDGNDIGWPADIYTISGVHIRSNAMPSHITALPRGVYILRTPRGVRKLVR